MAHMRQSRLGSGLSFQVLKIVQVVALETETVEVGVVKTVQVLPSSLGSGARSCSMVNAVPPWRQPRGKQMVSSVNPHSNATSRR